MYYFAYGCNTNIDQMHGRCPQSRIVGPAVLYDHELVFSHHCDIRPRRRRQVQGVLWSITPDCLERLDLLEGYPNYYLRPTHRVQIVDALSTPALCYQMKNQPALAPPDREYLSLVIQGYRENGLDLNQIQRALESATRGTK